MAATPAAPLTTRTRALAPDLARGLMLALIAVANVMIYLHGRPYGLRQHIVEEGLLERVVTAVVVTFVDARAYPLFAALFGYGLVRIAQRQAERGRGPREVRAVLRRRCRWLIAFGLVHAVLGFSGDVLGWYGLLGLVLAAMTGARERTLLVAAVVWLVPASAVQGLVYADPRIRVQRDFLWSYAIENPAVAAGWRLVEWASTPVGLLSVASPMLIGMWAARRRLLETPEQHLPLLRRTAVLGIAAGVLGGAGPALATAQVWTPSFPVALLLSWVHILTGVLCGLGYAAAITLAAHRLRTRSTGPLPGWAQALQATGRSSLSWSLAQSVVFVALLPAWTLGLGAVLGTAAAALLALITWAGTVLLAARWSRTGRTGPAEALLRRLTYPPRRTPPPGTEERP